MQKIFFSLLSIFVILFFTACSNRNVNIDPKVEETLLQPEAVDVYGIDINNLIVEKDDLRKQVKTFPFVSLNPVLDYRGKFSDQFYSLKPYKIRAKRIDEVDFWKLQNNPYMIDFIYVLPIWVENYKRVSDDVFQNIGYSFNLSLKEQEILKWWVKQGGVLWQETGIYTTLYDAYNKSGKINATKAKEVLNKKSQNQHYMDRNLHVVKYQAEKVDYINYKKREVVFDVNSNNNWLKDISKLRLVINNYAENYFLPDGDILVKTNNGVPLVTENMYGKGMILSMIPLSYNDTRFDGELLRWNLTEYALDKVVLKRNQPEKVVVVEKKVEMIQPEEKTEGVRIIDMRDLTEGVTEYCVQLYSDANESSFMSTLESHKSLKNIRGEIRGRYYTIRAGRYNTLAAAAKDVPYYRQYFGDAFARECVYKLEK